MLFTQTLNQFSFRVTNTHTVTDIFSELILNAYLDKKNVFKEN